MKSFYFPEFSIWVLQKNASITLIFVNNIICVRGYSA